MFHRLSFFATWLPVLIMDRINHSYSPGDCIFYTVEDRRFGIFYVTIGYPIPMALMVVCNIKVYSAVQRSRASVKPQAKSGSSNTTLTTAITTVKSTMISERKKEVVFQISDAATTSHQWASGSLQNHQTSRATPAVQVQRSSDVEKIFRNLCYVVGAYLILWLPYCITQSVVAFCTVSKVLVESLNGMSVLCYLNSAVNPFLYAVGSNDFRMAFKSMLGKVRCFRWSRSCTLYTVRRRAAHRPCRKLNCRQWCAYFNRKNMNLCNILAEETHKVAKNFTEVQWNSNL